MKGPSLTQIPRAPFLGAFIYTLLLVIKDWSEVITRGEEEPLLGGAII